jgi:hypothetical protein
VRARVGALPVRIGGFYLSVHYYYLGILARCHSHGAQSGSLTLALSTLRWEHARGRKFGFSFSWMRGLTLTGGLRLVDLMRPVEYFGQGASEEIRLEGDPECWNRDRYPRLPRYLYLLDDTLLNALIRCAG